MVSRVSIRRMASALALTATVALAAHPAAAKTSSPPTASAIDLPVEHPSEAVERLAAWAVGQGDTGGLPFIVIDKVAAAVFVFDADGRLQGATPALIGSATGDDTVPGIGDRALSSITPEERTTPAGRFTASFGRAIGLGRVLWVDYSSAVALHSVPTANPVERRMERLRTPDRNDNRITYGCINVPACFFENVVRPAFSNARGVVYILPDTRSLYDVFPGLLLQAHAAPHSATASSAGAPVEPPGNRALLAQAP
jgi:hypothetical protein